MANRKLTVVRIKLIALVLLMSLVSSNVAALGLGSLEVLSNLDQPFDAVVELTVAAGDDVDSVNATIASAEDFASFNIDYPSYLQDMTVSLDRSGAEPTLRVTSNEVVIKEPFIHFLIRIDWSGGSFLREYTALIDPPVYASETPRAISEPTVVGNDQAFQSTSSEDVSSSDVVSEQPEFNDAQPATQSNIQSAATDAQYGPVSQGETLSVIAQDLQRQFPDLSIYQIMQVLFEENRSAFIDENINGLLAGVVLNIADLNAIGSVDAEQSRDFFRDQMVQWDPSSLISGSESTIRVGQDDYVDNDDGLFANDTGSAAADAGSEQQDTFQLGSSSDTESFVSAAQGDNQQGEIIALQQEVTDLEASLSSGALENQELRERISILEGQLADVNRLMSLDVEDADLANLESTLAEQNNTDIGAALDEQEVVSELDDVNDLLDGIADDSLALTDDLQVDGSDDLVEEVEEIEEVVESAVAEQERPAVVTLSGQPSFLDSILDSGLSKVLAAVGAIIVAGLGLFLWRRRRADEEFEVSMMTIESHDDSNSNGDAASVSVASAAVSKSATESIDQTTKDDDGDETSFLTVYSDSDAVVQADEVDPVAEADVYIAYGRDEQAEAVLLDGISNKPERADIKHKLLSLYHKSSNSEGFERVSEELYAQKDQLDPQIWQEVSVMGKELLPNNPMFELSASELFVEKESSDALVESSVAEQDDSKLIDADDLVEANDESETIEFESSFSLEGSSSDEDSSLADDTPPTDKTSLADETSLTDSVLSLDDPEADDENSIHLVNFEDGVSELDEVNISSLGIDDDLNQLDLEDDDSIEIDLDEVIDFQPSDAVQANEADDDESDEDFAHEVSDLEVDDDYDEARTQYELAKVFVDLGDEDGARKILTEIVDNDNNSDDVLADAKELLNTIDS